jgi:hypothetical protein
MASLSSNSYTIGRSSGRCAASGVELKPGEAIVATLCERDGVEELLRLDFVADAWSAGARPQAPDRLVGFWRSTVHEPTVRHKPLMDDEAMLDLLSGMEPGDERREALRFVLALMLVRRKVLLPEGTGRGEVMRLRPRGVPAGSTAGIIEVRDPGLDEAAMTSALEQVQALAGAEGA